MVLENHYKCTNTPECIDCPIAHGYTGQNRGIGVADTAKAIKAKCPHHASGELACHFLEVMEAFEKSSDSDKAIALSQNHYQLPFRKVL